MKYVLCLALLCNFAFAGPCDPAKRVISGDTAAKSMVAALKLAGAVGTEVHDKTGDLVRIEFSAPALACLAISGGVYDDGLDQYACSTAPKKALANEANAKLIFDAMNSMGVFADYGMSKDHREASDIHCTVTMNLHNLPSYSCAMTAVWGDTCQP